MAVMLSFPLRLSADGGLAKVEQDSDDGLSEQIIIICMTARGERDLVPAFGIPDPTFQHTFDIAEVNATLALFSYPARVSGALLDFPDQQTERLRLPFTRV